MEKHFSSFIYININKINMYIESTRDSILHVYEQPCQLPSLDSRSHLEAYQWIRNKPIKMH